MIRKLNHKYLLALCAILFPLFTEAQSITARLDISRKDAVPDYVLYCPSDKGIVTLGQASPRSTRYIALNKYNEKFEKEWTKQVLEQNGRNSVDFMAVLGETSLVFVSEHFPRTSSIVTSCLRFDLDGNPVGGRETISELENEPRHRVDLDYTLSINKKVLLAYRNFDNDLKKEEILYFVFGPSGDKMYEGKLTLPYPDEKLQIRKLLVSNGGDIYVLSKFYTENRINSPDDFQYKIFLHSPETGETFEKDISFGNVFITDLTCKVSRDGGVLLAGFYSEKNSSQIIGTVYQRMDQNLESVISAQQRFEPGFLELFLSDKQIEKGKELRNFFLDDIVLRSDGGVLLVAERFYITYNSFPDMYGQWIDQKIYHYDEIIVASVDGEGKLEWSRGIMKRQSAQNDQSLSYFDMVTGEGLHILYEYEPRRLAKAVFTHTVTMEGNLSERKNFLGTETADCIFYPRTCEQVSNNEALLVWYQERSRIYSIVKVDFGE